MNTLGTVYLIHFDRPFGHAQHYVGWASCLAARIAHHRKGTGANLMKHVTRAGINWQVVRTWENTDRNFERRLHNRKNTAQLCPICQAAKHKT